jgi:hypothetical protein
MGSATRTAPSRLLPPCVAEEPGTVELADALDDKEERRCGLSDPRDAEVRPVPGLLSTLGTVAVPITEQSGRAGGAPALGVYVRSHFACNRRNRTAL